MQRKEKESFQILGLPESAGEEQIREAYHRLLRTVHPEEDPEGFQRLRGAYETALAYAGQGADAERDGGIFRSDMEPGSRVGRLLARADEIYASMKRRLDPGEWEELLKAPVLSSLDEGEGAKWSLFELLAEKYILPCEVWRTLDRAFLIRENRREFEEHLPEGFVAYIIDKIEDEKSRSDFWCEALEGADGADFDGFIRELSEYTGRIKQEQPDNRKRRAALGHLASYEISHPYLELEEAFLLLREGDGLHADAAGCPDWTFLGELSGTYRAGQEVIRKPSKERAAGKKWRAARAAFESLMERYPDREAIGIPCARGLQRLGEQETAHRIYESFLQKEELADNDRFLALCGMTVCYARRRQWKEAGSYAKKALSLGQADERYQEVLESVLPNEIEEYISRADDLTPEEAKELARSYVCLHQAKEGLAFFGAHSNLCADEPWYHRAAASWHLMSEDCGAAAGEAALWRACLERAKTQGPKEREELADAYEIEGIAWMRIYVKSREEEEAQDEESFARAEACLGRAQELAPDHPNYQMNRVLLYRAGLKYRTVVDLCEEILSKHPQAFTACVCLQEAYEGLQMAQEVVHTFYRAREIYDGYAEIYERAVKAFWSYEQTQDAKHVLDLAKEAGVTSLTLLVQELKVREDLLEEGDSRAWQEADDLADLVIRRIRKEIAAQKKTGQKLSRLDRELGQDTPRELLAQALMTRYYLNEDHRSDKAREALKYLKESQRLEDDTVKLYYIGRMYKIHFGDNKKALVYFKTCEERGMDFEWVYLYLAQIREDEGKQEEAIAYYQKAIECNPKSRHAYWQIGWIYLRRFNRISQPEDGENALKYFQLQDEMGGAQAWNSWRKAKIRYYLRDYEGALSDIEKSFDPDGDSGQWYLKGDILRMLRQYDQAIECYLTSIRAPERHNEDNAYCMEKILLCYTRKKDLPACIDCLRGLLGELSKKDRSDCCKMLAYAEAQRGDFGAALGWIEEGYGSADATKKHCRSLKKECERFWLINELQVIWREPRDIPAYAEANLPLMEKWVLREVRKEKESLADRAKLWKSLADVYFQATDYAGAARHYEQIYELIRGCGEDGDLDEEYVSDLTEHMMICYYYLGDLKKARRYGAIYRKRQERDFEEGRALGYTIEELIGRQTTGARAMLYRFFLSAYYTGKTGLAYDYAEKMEQKCVCYWCGEEECTELQETMARLAYLEGDDQKARLLCEAANRSCFRGKNEYAQMLLIMLDQKKRREQEETE